MSYKKSVNDSGFIGSQGTKFVGSHVHKEPTRIVDVISEMNTGRRLILPAANHSRLNTEISNSLNQLSSIRSRVDSQFIPLSEALGYYTR